jgi:translation elongation factor EF-4
LDAVLTETRRIFSEEEILEVSAKTGANVPDLLRKISERLILAAPTT